MRLIDAAPLFGQLDLRVQQATLALKSKGFSNFDEEQIIRRYMAALRPAGGAGVAVDIGAGDGVRHSNTHALFVAGWRGVAVEADGHKVAKLARVYRNHAGVFVCRTLVTPHNVGPLLQTYGLARDFDLLSIDIDSYDYWVLDALLHHYRPRLVVSEINEKIPPPIRFVVNFDPEFRLTHHFYGHSIASLADLAARHRYTLVELEYNNAFLMPVELAPTPALTAAAVYRRGYLERPDRQTKFRLNHDMEVLHTLSPEAGVRFLREFYAQHRGKYELGLTAPTN